MKIISIIVLFLATTQANAWDVYQGNGGVYNSYRDSEQQRQVDQLRRQQQQMQYEMDRMRADENRRRNEEYLRLLNRNNSRYR